MTEDQVLGQWYLLMERWHFLLQWWAGVSFGVIAVAHFASKRLNLAIVLLILLVYVSQTANTLIFAIRLGGMTEGVTQELMRLSASGEISAIGQAWLQSQDPAWAPLTYLLAPGGLCLGCVAYLIYCYRRQRRLAS
jgi:hypothetical protein